MTTTQLSVLKRTALFAEHQSLGGRLIDFGGWELPVQYSGVMDEHKACREAAGLFDVSHMGEFHVEGNDSPAFLNYLLTNDIGKLAVHQAQYTLMCNPEGGLVDDLVVYRRGDTRFLVVVNASNTDKDFAWAQKILTEFLGKTPGAQVILENRSADYTQIALQGRKAQEILSQITSTDLGSIKTYWFTEGQVAGDIPAVIARTGYTGEDGFEIYVPWEQGPQVWKALLTAGQPHGLKPCGLGARDTLRLEMKYPLYGNELGDHTNALECGLGWVIKLDKGSDFVGRTSLIASKEAGLKKSIVGLKMLERGIPRHGYPVHASPDPSAPTIGEVTSGTQSPSLGYSIAVVSVAKEYAAIGTSLWVDIRGARVKAEVIPTPFYKKPY